MARTKKSFRSECVFTLRLLISFFSLCLFIASLTVLLGAWTHCLLFIQFLFALVVVAPFNRLRIPYWRTIGAIAAACFMCTIVYGLLQSVEPPDKGEVFSLENGSSLSLGEIVPERDIVLLATRVLPFMGGLSFTEASGLLPAFISLYDHMKLERGSHSSLLMETLVGAPYVYASRVLTYHSSQHDSSNRAVIFLHGAGGNFGLVCWLISQAGGSIGASTYCPSLGIVGAWGSERGEAIFESLLNDLNSKGKDEIYLVSLSAGAVGASILASKFQERINAVALLFGGHPAIRQVKLPLFMMFASKDERFPRNLLAWVAEAAADSNPQATIEEVDGGHFFLVKNYDQLLKQLTAWLGDVVTTQK